MQLKLPIFPKGTKLINSCLGVYEKNGIVCYLHSGSPIFSHGISDRNTFRLITANLIDQGLCTAKELSIALGVTQRRMQRNVAHLRKHGIGYFFQSPNREGNCHKLTGDRLLVAQSYLDSGWNNSRIARELGVVEGCIRYHLTTGKLVKPSDPPVRENGSTRKDRSEADGQAGEGFGIGATRIGDRIAAAFGQIDQAEPVFEESQSVCQGGVLFLLPALIEQGLLTTEKVYTRLSKGFYGFTTVVLFLAFMALSRIKCPEQLKQYKPGEWGKLLGLDRAPETKCLRRKLNEIIQQDKAEELNEALARKWVEREQTAFFFVDGHVQVYHGRAANLGKKHIARQKLCLPGTGEFWINNSTGQPYGLVCGQVNEKLQQMLKEEIVPKIKSGLLPSCPDLPSKQASDVPLFTLVFDREAYSPAFFRELWEKDRIAVITYKKNVRDKWPTEEFSLVKAIVIEKQREMRVAERAVTLAGMKMREIRKLGEEGHQTTIITTHPHISIEQVAGYMFSRWSQENYFRYMRQDYDLDRMVQYSVNQLDGDLIVNNPAYSKLTSKIKRNKEKIARRQARIYQLTERHAKEDLNKGARILKQIEKEKEELEVLENIDQKLKAERSQHRVKIQIKDMPEQVKYNKLESKGKQFMHVMKMICYRAETAFAGLIGQYFQRKDEEGRMLTKAIIQADADLLPDYKNRTLTITLHTLSTKRANHAASKMCQLLNEAELNYPGTNLKLVYRTTTS